MLPFLNTIFDSLHSDRDLFTNNRVSMYNNRIKSRQRSSGSSEERKKHWFYLLMLRKANMYTKCSFSGSCRWFYEFANIMWKIAANIDKSKGQQTQTVVNLDREKKCVSKTSKWKKSSTIRMHRNRYQTGTQYTYCVFFSSSSRFVFNWLSLVFFPAHKSFSLALTSSSSFFHVIYRGKLKIYAQNWSEAVARCAIESETKY